MALEGLKSRLTILVVASILAWAFGILAAVLSENPLPTLFPADSPVTIISIAIFTFSFLFFGYPSPFMMFLGGLFAGNHVRAADFDAFTALLSIACVLAAYSSIRLGDALLDDMIGKGNFKHAVKITFILVVLFLAISVGVDLSG